MLAIYRTSCDHVRFIMLRKLYTDFYQRFTIHCTIHSHRSIIGAPKMRNSNGAINFFYRNIKHFSIAHCTFKALDLFCLIFGVST